MKKIIKVVNTHSLGITFSPEEIKIYDLEPNKIIEITIREND